MNTKKSTDIQFEHEVDSLCKHIENIPSFKIYGVVFAIQGLIVKVKLSNCVVSLGCQCTLYPNQVSLSTVSNVVIEPLTAEVVGFADNCVLIMPYGSLNGINAGSKVEFHSEYPSVFPSALWKGRILNALAEPIDGLGEIPLGSVPYPIHAKPLVSAKRSRIKDRLDVGVRAVNTFLTCCKGQRMGIFAGSGVGKSMLLSMFAKFTECDICVIGLIGERGREVKEFIEETLGKEGLAKSILVVATSDESPLMRRQAAYMTMTIAEFFRDQGLSVLCLMDSITRFAMAQREIGLSAGEPPTTKGYTPSVFSLLPQLLERAGPGISPEYSKRGSGFITGLFTVLVDGDDTNEPIADAVRGILDGHIILDRAIAERGRFPAINVLKSISRTVPACHSEEEQQIIKNLRLLMANYEDMADMIRLGAYKAGSNPNIDEAISKMPKILEFLTQKGHEKTSIKESFNMLAEIY